jgi:regulator of sirC expression with transglutaminase-like and TPR domain
VRLRACTAVIDGTAYGAEEKALAYRNRGNARADAGASMQAVSDFSQAIRLRPDDASCSVIGLVLLYSPRGLHRLLQ